MLSYSPFCFSVHLTSIFFFFFFNDPATTEIYTLSLHYALPIAVLPHPDGGCRSQARLLRVSRDGPRVRSRDDAAEPRGHRGHLALAPRARRRRGRRSPAPPFLRGLRPVPAPPLFPRPLRLDGL